MKSINRQKKKYKNRNIFLDETAISEVLGFIIIMGIIISGLSLYLTLQVPEWAKEFEAEHAAKVPHDFAKLDSAIDMAILTGETNNPAECLIGMAPRAVPPVILPSSGTLSFDPNDETFEIIACAPGEPVNSGNDSWDSTPVNFSNYEKFQVVTLDRGAELALEIGEDKIYNSGGEEYLAGEFWFNHFTVIGNTILYTSELAIHAINITIGPGSAIVTDGCGSAGGKYDEPGKGDGSGSCPIETTDEYRRGNFSAGGGGAGYGEDGGAGGAAKCRGIFYFANTTFHYLGDSWGDGGQNGSVYGSEIDISFHAGSGGGGGACGRPIPQLGNACYVGGKGGAGGGSIFLDAPVIIVSGTLSANGEAGGNVIGYARNSAGGGGGGGSGGSILLKGEHVTITGNLYANGGDGGNGGNAQKKYGTIPVNAGGGGGGGAGGRIKAFYGSNFSAPGGLNSHVDVDGGANGAGGNAPSGGADGVDGSPGASGTVYNHSILYTPPVFHYDTGYIISTVHNTTNPLVCYGNMTWNETVPEDTNIIMKVRTSMDENMASAMSWEDCPAVTNGMDISGFSSVSNGHQYIQWRAELATFDLSKTPTLQSVTIEYEYGIPYILNSSGSMHYSSHYKNLPDFKLIYAHGATIRGQTEGEFMLYSPPIAMSKQGDATSLKITALSLTGGERTFSGALRTTVKPFYHGSALITGGLNFRNITINITTQHPTAWNEWLNETCKEAGLEYGTKAGEYNIVGAENSLQIIFYGNESKPVNLWLKRVGAKIEIENKLL